MPECCYYSSKIVKKETEIRYFACFVGMITGASAAAVCYNIKLRHPMLELPIIDYDLALLFQPMLVLGISIGVTLNVIFADWMVTVLLIILFLGKNLVHCNFVSLENFA